MNKIGLSRLAVYTVQEKKNQLLAALHFLQEERSLEEVMLEVKEQYGSLESELQKKLPPIFQWVKSSEDVLLLGFWLNGVPKEMRSLITNGLFESMARCSKRQLSVLRIKNLRGTLLPELTTFGGQFEPETNFCIVDFAYDTRVFPFAVTATQIQK